MGSASAPSRTRSRPEDNSSKAPVHKGTLWKLNTDSNAKDPVNWLRRDMWIAHTGSLCYYSLKDHKRLVLIDRSKLAGASISKFTGGARENAFEVRTVSDADERKTDSAVFACESQEEYELWTKQLMRASTLEIPTMQLGAAMANDIRQFMVEVRNRRMKVSEENRDEFAPNFKATLWKVKGEGDKMKPGDWFEREMWVSKNGSLVYWSPKEERELIYYTHADLARATVSKIPDGTSCRPR